MDIPVYALCGALGSVGSEGVIYTTRIEITMTREDIDHGELIVAPDIVAGEINPGETVVVDCDDILQEQEAFSGFLSVRLYPRDAFRVQVTYGVRRR